MSKITACRSPQMGHLWSAQTRSVVWLDVIPIGLSTKKYICLTLATPLPSNLAHNHFALTENFLLILFINNVYIQCTYTWRHMKMLWLTLAEGMNWVHSHIVERRKYLQFLLLQTELIGCLRAPLSAICTRDSTAQVTDALANKYIYI